MKLELEDSEVMAILQLMGETPAKNGYYPLMVKLQGQVNAELEARKQPPAEPKGAADAT